MGALTGVEARRGTRDLAWSMAKLKLAIEKDVDFRVSAEIEALGYEVKAGVRFGRKRQGQHLDRLPDPSVLELPSGDFEEVDFVEEESEESA